MFAWDDIAVFLALHRERTTGRAAAALGVSQPTVVRRIAALERAVGLQLFARGANGFSLTSNGEALLSVAEKAAAAMQAVEDCVQAVRGSESESIRVTVLDQAEQLLSPVLRSHHQQWPMVQVQLMTSYRRFDLGAGEAEIALRAGVSFPEDQVLVREMPVAGWGIYVSRNLDEALWPRSLDEVGRLPLAGGEGNLALLPSLQWFETLAGPNGVAVRCNSFAAVRANIIEGGIGILPCFGGGSDPALIPCFAPIPQLMVPMYLGVRREALRRPAVRDLFEAISAHLIGRADLIGGKAPPPRTRL